MIYVLIALIVVLFVLTVVMAGLLIELLQEFRWIRGVLVPWINALNTKLGLPK